MKEQHLHYLKERGVCPLLVRDRYRSEGDHLAIRFEDPEGHPYLDHKGDPFIALRLFPTQRPKFKAPPCSGSRPYFSPLMPAGYLDDTTKPVVWVEGPVKVDALYAAGITGFCFIGLMGTWNTRDKRDEDGIWHDDNDTRLLPELRVVALRGRKSITLFDSDIEDNPSVSDAATAIGNWTRQSGAKPHRCQLPSEPDGAKNGADDFVVRHGAQALLDLLDAAEVEGWPLPASLLTHDGELKRSYTPAERKRLMKALAEINDVQTVDDTCRALAGKLRIPHSQLLADIDDTRAGTTENGFLGGEEELEGDDDLDQNWIVPYLLPRGETIVLSADPGVGKTLFCYSLAYASATGTEFLGFPVLKGVPLILQLEEGGSFKRRVKAVGLAKSEGWEGLKVGEQWFFSKTFDLAKPRQVEQLKLLIRNNIDLVVVDSARAVARSLAVDENHADFGKLVIRKIAKMISDCGKAGVIVHHNSGSGKASGTKDIPAGVWGLFNLKQDQSANNLRTLQSDKLREGTSILWQLSLDQTEGKDGSPDGWEWKLVGDLSHMAPDLTWRERFYNLLLMQSQPITFRDAGELMGLGQSELHSMRNSVLKDRSLMRWSQGKVKQGAQTKFFVPVEVRPEGTQHLNTSDQNQAGVVRRDSHPIGVIDKSMEVVKEDSHRLESSLTHDLHSVDNYGSDLHTFGPDLHGVCVGGAIQTPLENGKSVEVAVPTLNGETDAFWQIVNAHPGAQPNQIANKLLAITGRHLTDEEVQALIQQRSKAA